MRKKEKGKEKEQEKEKKSLRKMIYKYPIAQGFYNMLCGGYGILGI